MLLIILTLYTVVIIRQNVHRYWNNESPPPSGIIFTKITRKDADYSFVGLVMFFFNFLFYKFGVEFTYMLMVISIGSRHDIFGVFQSLWLCVLVLLNRCILSKVWPVFVGFIGLVLPIQYILALGLPYALCLKYPWTSLLNPTLREWLYLPDYSDTLNVHKIYFDFFVFLLACRQMLNFRIESADLTYAGGSNIETHLELPSLKNKHIVPDCFTFGKTTLDSAKSLFFFCFYWITLAVIFLAGTSRVSLFALGYVLGCFILLWNGNEFYLKPIKIIFKLWKSLLAYTTAVVLLKSLLQVSNDSFFHHKTVVKVFAILIFFLNLDCGVYLHGIPLC